MALKLPLGGLEFVLLFILVAFALLVWRGVRRRGAFVAEMDGSVLPTLTTEVRITGKVRRMWRDPDQGLPLVELAVGKRIFIFCPTDHTENAERYRLKIGKEVTVAPFGLATLEPGGAESIKDQISDADKLEITEELLRFLHTGQLANDYFAIGRVISYREESWEDVLLTLYRLQTAPDLTIEVAMQEAADRRPFAEKSMVHGSVRLFGYLAN